MIFVNRILIVFMVVIIALVGFQLVQQAPQPTPSSKPTSNTANIDTPSTIRLASFNLKNLGYNYEDRNLNDMAYVLAHFDIIALQEVMKKSGVDVGSGQELTELDALVQDVQSETASDGNPTWAVVRTDEPIITNNRYEYYAILYRTDRVEYTGVKGLFLDNQTPSSEFPFGEFAREPFHANFRAGSFDFTLIDFHADDPDSKSRDEEIRAC